MKHSELFRSTTSSIKIKEVRPTTIKAIANEIKLEHKQITKQIVSTKSKDKRTALKKKLPYFTSSNILRYTDSIKSFPQYLTFDIDHIKNVDLPPLKQEITALKEVVLAFISPSHTGIKFIVKLDNPIDPVHFSAFYARLVNKYQDLLEVDIDPLLDLTRATYICYDPDVFYNEDCTEPIKTAKILKKIKKDKDNALNQQEELTLIDCTEEIDVELEKAIESIREEYHLVADHRLFSNLFYCLLTIGEDGLRHFVYLNSDNPDQPQDTPAKLTKDFRKGLQRTINDPIKGLNIHSFFGIIKDLFNYTSNVSSIAGFEFNDMAFIERALPMLTDYKLNRNSKNWLKWNGNCWEEEYDQAGQFDTYFRSTIIPLEIERIQADPVLRIAKKNILSTAYNSAHKVIALKQLLKLEKELGVNKKQLDSNPNLFNIQNTTINLEKAIPETLTPTKEHFITKKAPVTFILKTKPTPYWDDFLELITLGDTALQEFLYRILGMSLQGDQNAKAFFVLYGTGNNGKSTFTKAISNLVGDYGSQIDYSVFVKPRYASGDSASPRLLDMVKYRMVFIDEITSDYFSSLNSVMLKNMTGGEPIVGRSMRSNEIQKIYPQCTLFFSGNDPMRIEDHSIALKSRLYQIPFQYHFNKPKPMEEVLTLFNKEKNNIFHKILKGYTQYRKIGLAPPTVVTEATNKLFFDQDEIQQFMNRAVIEEKGGIIILEDLRMAMIEFGINNNINSLKNIQPLKLTNGIRLLGFTVSKTGGFMNNRNYLEGYKLLENLVDTEKDKELPV